MARCQFFCATAAGVRFTNAHSLSALCTPPQVLRCRQANTCGGLAASTFFTALKDIGFNSPL